MGKHKKSNFEQITDNAMQYLCEFTDKVVKCEPDIEVNETMMKIAQLAYRAKINTIPQDLLDGLEEFKAVQSEVKKRIACAKK